MDTVFCVCQRASQKVLISSSRGRACKINNLIYSSLELQEEAGSVFSVLDNNKVYQKTLNINFRQEGLTAAVVVAVVLWRSCSLGQKILLKIMGLQRCRYIVSKSHKPASISKFLFCLLNLMMGSESGNQAMRAITGNVI